MIEVEEEELYLLAYYMRLEILAFNNFQDIPIVVDFSQSK